MNTKYKTSSVAALFLCCFLGGCVARMEQPATPDTARTSVSLAWVLGTSDGVDTAPTPDNDTPPSPEDCWNCDGSGTVGDTRVIRDCKICDRDGDGDKNDPIPHNKTQPGALEEKLIEDVSLGFLELLLAGVDAVANRPGANPLDNNEPLSPELQSILYEFSKQVANDPEWKPSFDTNDKKGGKLGYAWLYFCLSGMHPSCREQSSAENTEEAASSPEGTGSVPAEPFWTTWEQMHLQLNDKPIFVLVTFEECTPCEAFKNLLRDPEVEPYLVANFNLVEDDIADWKLPNAPRIAVVPSTGGQGIDIPTRVAPTSKVELMKFLRSSNPREKSYE